MPKPRSTRSPAKVVALNARKTAHLDACLDPAVDLGRDSFDRLKLRYSALPEIALADVSTGTEFAGMPIAAPLLISCMTGGAGERFLRINRHLAQAAERLSLPLGLGSMKVLLEHPGAAASFRVRDLARSVPLIANLGLVSFNYGVTADDLERIRDLVQPDVFALHLNALQEAVQPGGDTDFRGLSARLEALVRRCPIPVLVKECGGGIAPALVRRLLELGVRYVDVSGNDGTSWAAVEGLAHGGDPMGEVFKDFGLPTAWILERLPAALAGGPSAKGRIVAGGGIRNGVQAAKALALGADYVTMARPFLLAAEESAEAVEAVARRLMHELRTAMFLTGVTGLEQLDRSLFVEGYGPATSA